MRGGEREVCLCSDTLLENALHFCPSSAGIECKRMPHCSYKIPKFR